jgi:hypothetical protein
MKRVTVYIVACLFAQALYGQKLMDIYKNGTVRLTPDTEYAKGNDWDKVFKTYYDTMYNQHMGDRKSLKVLPDGSVVVNHAYRNYYTKFSPSGKFEKEFGVKNSKGVQFKNVNGIEGIVNNNTFFTGLDNMGKMNCFDFNGNYIKSLKLNYMTRQMTPLPNGKIAVVGWVIWEKKFRDFVSIVDYATNKEQVIWEHFTERENGFPKPQLFHYQYLFKERGAFSINTMPHASVVGMNPSPMIANVGNKLIIALSSLGKILVYDLQEKLLETSTIPWAKNYLSVEEQKEIQQNYIDKFQAMKEPRFASWVSNEENKLARETILKQMKDDLTKIKDPIPIPSFSTIIQDSDGNLLFFEYPKEANANKFNVWVYENNGKFICQSSFVCEDYNLNINSGKMVFHKGYIYGLQLLKNAPWVPLRLVRFKVGN